MSSIDLLAQEDGYDGPLPEGEYDEEPRERAIVSGYTVTYPKPPKGWKGIGFYYETKELGEAEVVATTVEECAAEVRRLFPEANNFRARNVGDPPDKWWVSGSIW